jgi:hypothetical protein
MSAQTELFECYRLWRLWSDKERVAVSAGDWTALDRAQKEKGNLQTEILRWTAAAKATLNSEEAAPIRHGLQRTLQDLIVFETQTIDLIAQMRARAQRQAQELQRTVATLKRVHKSYGTARDPVWTSYS